MQSNDVMYYPFSRCINQELMKQLLLIFDSITFLDPVEEDWRRELFKDLEVEHHGYRAYRDVSCFMPWLRQNGIVRIVRPQALHSIQSDLTTAATLSDLQDETWINAANPLPYQLPTPRNTANGQPIWQVFSDKIPAKFMEALTNEPLFARHLLFEGGNRFAWDLSYAAGSSVGINVHLAAAEELGLAPVTDSRLHHDLVLLKLAREVNASTSSLQTENFADYLARQAVFTIIKEILPKESLEKLSLDDIIDFRTRTKHARENFLREIKVSILSEGDLSKQNHLVIETKIKSDVFKQTKLYGDELAAVRDRLWPKLIDGLTGRLPLTTTGAGLVGSYISGSGYVLAASVLLHALQPLKMALDWRADLKKVQRSTSGAIAYLSQVRSLAPSRKL